jgi:hypothetical protein
MSNTSDQSSTTKHLERRPGVDDMNSEKTVVDAGVHDARLEKRVAKIIFASLVLDLTAFTCILPLFPRLVEHFMRDQDRSWLLAGILDRIRQVRLAIGASEWSHSW